LKIEESFKKDGSYGYESDFEGLERVFSEHDNHMKIFDQQKFPISLLCEFPKLNEGRIANWLRNHLGHH
jgi:hypothetical protein